MAKNTINIDDLNNAINAELKEYNRDVVKGVKKFTKRAMTDLVKNTQATAPEGKRSEHYKENIASRTLAETDSTLIKQWYVKGSDYRLTHLLNNGHALRDGGRYAGTNFLGRAVDHIVPWYTDQIEKVLKNGK